LIYDNIAQRGVSLEEVKFHSINKKTLTDFHHKRETTAKSEITGFLSYIDCVYALE